MKSPASANSSKQNNKAPLRRKLGFWLCILAVIIVAAIYINRGGFTSKKGRGPQPAPVVVAKAVTKDVPVYLNALGGVTPTYSVTVHTQIDGTLMQVFFREGQMIRKGDVLAQIDDRPYQAQLVQYQGQLIRDQALLDNARVDLKRYQKLWKQDSVSQQVLATQQALVRQLEGTVKIDLGQIQATKVNISYCRITSPIDGRVGLRLVDPGNYVQTSDATGIAVLNMLNPITIIFTIPEDNIDDVLQMAYTDKTMKVDAFDRTQKTLLDTGKLLTMDNQVDPTTGTVKLRAQFSNDKNQLFPNQFVNVRLLVKTLKNVTAIPTAGIQYDASGQGYVYILNNDMTVTYKPVKLGVTFGENTVVTSGVSPGESVVTEGADKLANGSAVTVGSGKKAAEGASEQAPANAAMAHDKRHHLA